MDNIKRNGAGYYDPTAFQAIKNTEKGAKKTMEIYRGDIFYIKKINQDTGRPAVIVSNNDINESQNMVEVAYLVEKPNESLPTHAKVRCHLPSTALCEQVVSVSKDRIDGFIRTCTDEEIERINKQQELEKQLSQIETENTDETIKVAAERDIYKDLYMKLTEKLIGDKI